ncbi:DUF6261 family protein [Streptococcus dentiloxodontae]
MSEKGIVRLGVTDLANAEVYQLVQRFIAQIDAENVSIGDDVVVVDLVTAIRKELPILQKANHQVRGSNDSKKIAELDKLRDQALQIFFDSHKLHRFDPEKKEDYDELNRQLAAFKGIKSVSYERETELVNNLLLKFSASPVKEIISSLGLTKQLEAIATRQADFEEAYSKRSSDNSKKVSYDTKQLRESLVSAPLRYLRLISSHPCRGSR